MILTLRVFGSGRLSPVGHYGRVTIYHLAQVDHWDAAQRTGEYVQSTRGRSLADEGFIHASSAEQWPLVRTRFYADYPEPLVLLTIEERLIGAPVVEEVGNPETGETFPHIYGALPNEAVTHTRLIFPPHADASGA